MNKQKITQKMSELGMAWSVRSDKYIDPNDGYGARPTYHIHPVSVERGLLCRVVLTG